MSLRPVLPIVHVNGTSRKELVELRTAVLRATGPAVLALQAMAPNLRDYYPEPARYAEACAQHERRYAALIALQNEIAAERQDLMDR